MSIVLSLPIWLTAQAKADVLVGIVNIQRIMSEIKQGAKINEKLQKMYEQKKGELKTDEDNIKKAQQELSKQASLLSADARAKKEKKIQEDILQLQQKTMNYQQEIQKQEGELKKPILDRLKEIVDEVSKKNNVDFTVEVSNSPVVYAKNKVELSEMVIKEYDKKHGK